MAAYIRANLSPNIVAAFLHTGSCSKFLANKKKSRKTGFWKSFFAIFWILCSSFDPGQWLSIYILKYLPPSTLPIPDIRTIFWDHFPSSKRKCLTVGRSEEGNTLERVFCQEILQLERRGTEDAIAQSRRRRDADFQSL